MSDFAAIQRMSDDELHQKLKSHGLNQPVNASTRKILEKKLAKILKVEGLDDSRVGNEAEQEDDDEGDYTMNQTSSSPPDAADVVRRRGHKGHDTFGNSFYVEEVDAKPSEQLRARRASELEHLQEALQTQAELQKELGGAEDPSTKGSRTALMILAILVVIGVFLIISYMTEGESADELMRMPTVKVAPVTTGAAAGVKSVPGEDPPV